MKATISYGEKSLTVEAESFHIAPPNQVEERDGITVLSHSIDNPVDSEPFSHFIEDEFLIVVNDAQRPTLTPAVLEVLLERVTHNEFSIAVATGSHAPPNEKELTYIFGNYYPRFKEKIHIHKALDTPHDYYGTTSQGIEVYFDRIIKNFRKIIVIGSVEPHYFAGFTGGRKGFLPGLASYKTIEQNHKFALEKEAKNLALHGNPVHEGMEEAVKLIQKDIFAVNMVLDQNRRVFACSSGNIFSSFYEATDHSKRAYCVPTPRRDIVLAVAPYPLDVTLYQAQKAIENGKLALNDQGILILVAQCRNGIGPDTFYTLLKQSKTPVEALNSLKKGYKLGYHKAGKIAELTIRAQIWAVTDLEPSILEDVFMKPYTSVQSALNDAIREKGGEVLVLPEASMTVPMCELACLH
ncbi:MAG: nickel-dependent lactate racemase [Theionarchaea archaeon]|nr:nickel-dependent lactate racemase [Theionarchaea archaeon]